MNEKIENKHLESIAGGGFLDEEMATMSDEKILQIVRDQRRLIKSALSSPKNAKTFAEEAVNVGCIKDQSAFFKLLRNKAGKTGDVGKVEYFNNLYEQTSSTPR